MDAFVRGVQGGIMMSEQRLIDKSEQWKIDGNCSVCRRNSYCKQRCTANKRITQNLITARVGSLFLGYLKRK